MTSVLQGKIIHRFQLAHPETNRRETRTIASAAPSAESCSKKDKTSKHGRGLSNKSTAQEHCGYQNCGFIFIPNDTLHLQLRKQEYLLSLPKRLLKLASEAVQLDRNVTIRRYTEIPFVESLSTCRQTDDIRVPATSSPSTACAMIEVYDLELFPAEVPETAKKARVCGGSDTSSHTQQKGNNIWSITQFWRKERLDFQKMKNSRPKFSLLATVDAISPIVALDPSTPFALVEVYDKENTDVTCVVVLHGKAAMSNHAAIHPLDTLVFRDVVYKPWAVHKVLYDDKNTKGSTSSTAYSPFTGRVPSHVFVATRVDSVSWSDTNSNTVPPAASFRNTCPSPSLLRRSLPPLITPIHLVATISGRILKVQTISISLGHRKATVIHYLEMVLLNPSTCGVSDKDGVNGELPSEPTSRPRCRLYLSYFPMPVALQCSLRKEAIVQAYNVHLISTQQNSCFAFDVDNEIVISYGACLRSTLILLKHATDVTSKKEYYSIGLNMKFVNYGFRKIKQTYLQDLYFEHVEDWEHRSFRKSSHGVLQTDCTVKHVPRMWIVNALLDSNRNSWGTKNEVNSDCSGDSRLLSGIPTNQRDSIRSPYAEFFDHPFSSCVNDGVNEQNASCSCHLSMEDRKGSSSQSSSLLDLNGIRVASQSYFENHISKLLNSPATLQNVVPPHQVRKGFHGSIRVPLRKLYAKGWKENHVRKESEGDVGNDGVNNCLYFVGGFVSEVHAQDSSVSSIADGSCRIPISFDKKPCHAEINDFVMGQFDSVMISCLCVGKLMADNTREHKLNTTSSSGIKSMSLPALDSRENLSGNCTLVTVNGFLFVTAIQIHCREYQLHKMATPSSKTQEDICLEDPTLTVEGYLTTQQHPSEPLESATLMGMLTRCQFRSRTTTDGSHNCYRLTVSSLKRDESKDIESDNSCLQALELTISVTQNAARMAKFNELLAIGWPNVNFIGSQQTMASSFWVLGDSGRTCAMTFGGTEDIVPGSSCSESIVKITFPSSSLYLNKLGYSHCLCTHDCLDAFFENCRHSNEDDQPRITHAKNSSIQSFDFVGDRRVMNGILHQRPSRRNIFKPDIYPPRPIGELSTLLSNAIPSNTLSDLFELVFRGLRETNKAQRIMNPTMVRRIAKGRFLGVSFCQIHCYCTRCFCSLVSSPSNVEEEVSRKRKRDDSFDEPSFWHLPRSEEPLLDTHRTSSSKAGVADNSTSALPQHIHLSNLRCPKKNCPKHIFGIKWECSGVLDDGTGQATMYANGDAALTLLGMSAEMIQIIEEGVWSMRDGTIQFMKSIPPPKKLRDKVIAVLSERRGHDRKESAMVDPFRQLSIQDRATYIFERHCRSSSQPRRPLDYYVRCKPLVSKGDAIPHLRHTSIDSFFENCGKNKNASSVIYRSQVASYTIPSLKLELVDCGVSSLESLRTNF